jgi:hypothetical protein
MENVKLEKIYLVGVHDLYPGLEENPSALLKDIPQTTAIEFIAYLLHLYNVRTRDDHRFQSGHLIQWMMQMENADRIKISDFIQLNEKQVFTSSFKVLDRRPMLNLIQHILVYCRPGNDVLTQSDYSCLFKCLIYFNSLENEVQEKLFNWDGNGSTDQFANYIMTAQIRNIEHESSKDYVIQFLKVYYFFEFLTSHKKYSRHLDIFISTLGLTNYNEYLFKIVHPFLNLLTSGTPSPKMHIDDAGEKMLFYSRLTINGKITKTDKDYKALRQYPLFETEHHIYLFLDYRFFIDKIYQGLLFDFTAITDIPFSNLKSDIGREFSEHILFYTIMNKCFGQYATTCLTGENIKARMNDGEPDYYIRKDSKIFLFEFKDITLSANVKYSGDAEEIKSGIAEKLEINIKGKQKGIKQLINTIRNLRTGLYNEKAIDVIDRKGMTIFPIIVHTDVSLESCGVNYFLSKRMKQLLALEDIEGITIKDLVMINLDTLIKLQDHFSDGKLDIEDCINNYVSYISSENSQTATFPFDGFLKYYFTHKHKIKIGEPHDFASIIKSFADARSSE